MIHKLEPIVILLTGLLMFMILSLFAAEQFFKDDAVFFQTLAGIASGISGALMMRVRPQSTKEDQPPQTVQVQQTDQGSRVEVKS